MNSCKKNIEEIDSDLKKLAELKNFKIDDNDYVKVDQEINDIQKQIDNNKSTDLERKTMVLISKQKNKNIEIYYIVYLLFSIIFIIIQMSFIFFYN